MRPAPGRPHSTPCSSRLRRSSVLETSTRNSRCETKYDTSRRACGTSSCDASRKPPSRTRPKTISPRTRAAISTTARSAASTHPLSSLPSEQAARRHLETHAADYGLDLAPRLKVVKVSEPPKRGGGIKVETAADLVAKLKNEAGVL